MARKRAASTPSPRRPARRQRRRVVYEDESKNIDTNSEDFGSEFANVSDESTDSMSLYEPESPESTPKLSNVRKGSSGQSSGPTLQPTSDKTPTAKSTPPKNNADEISEKHRMKIRDTFTYRNGIAVDDPPIDSVEEMLADMTKRVLQEGFQKFIDRLAGTPLKYASMCSGADTGKIALDQAIKYLMSCDKKLRVEHCFAAEIVEWKQAFIRRNHSVPMIFRDITEFLVAAEDNSKPLEATTAFGGKATVPEDIDLLHAGFCCVDFSAMNNRKKTVEQQGESGATFMAIRKYAELHKPRMIIFENVLKAPWAKLKNWMYDSGYASRWLRVDTKAYSLPETRIRGYMLCIHMGKFPEGSKKLESLLDDWLRLFKELGRRASVPFETFLLSPDDPRLDMTQIDELNDQKSTPWMKCKQRHVDTRRDLDLGNGRPITDWNEDGSYTIPDFHKYVKGFTQRVSDTIDIAHLRNISRGIDDRYYSRPIDLSQNVDRYKDTTNDGIVPCVTPHNMLFTTVGGRRIIGIEALMLQGFPIDQLELSQITQAQQMDLAGNAMSSTVIGAATLAALAKFPKLFDRKKGNPEALELKFNPHLDGENELVPKTMDPTTYEEKTVDEAKSLVRLTRRLCYCEGRQNNWAIDFQQCQVCNSTTCTRCGRKPRHDYVLISKTVIGERKRPAEFEQLLKKCLPMKITFAHPLANSKEYVDSLFEIHRHGIDPELWLLIKPAIEIAFSSEVYFRSIRRVENWQVVYDSSKARVVLVLSEEKVEWLLYANVDREPLSSHYRRYLEQFPIARMQAQGQLTRGDWSFWLPNEREVKAMITGKGQLVKSYEATCGLTNHLETYVWSEYSVDIAKKDYAFFEHPIHGNYELSSQCGQAFNSLHVRKESQGSKTPLFFYFEHQRMSGDPKKHFFVFTHDKSRLGHGEPRRTIARLLPSWHQPRVQAIQTAESLKFMTEESEELIDRSEIPTEKQVKIYVDGRWTELPQFSFNFLDRTPVTIYQLPQKLLSPIRNSCKSQRAALTVRATHLGEISSSWIRGQWTLITRENEADFIRSFRWMFEHGLVMDGYSQMTERRDGIENWRGIRACTNHHPCLACSPAPPKMLWAFKYGKQEPFEDPEEATVYEQSLKSRPLPINIMYYTDGRDNFEIKIGINPESLICRAKARLGCKNYAHEISTSWRLVTDDDSARKPELPPLTLKTHSAVEGTVVGPWESRPIFHRLLSHQRGPFIWMYHQERFPKYFTQEEVVEAQVPHIGYRVEGKAASTIPLRGGVANYPVGSGKTAEMLALIDSLRDEDKQHAQQLSNGTIYLKATIIFVPTALSRQWSSEIKKFLPEQKDNVLVIQNFKQFQKLTVEDFMNAEIIVMNVEILKSPQYSFLLAQFAGIVECAENESPRAKAAWYRMALEKVPGNVALLAANPSQFQANLKEQFKHDFHKSQSATTPIPSKRTTGASFQTWEQRRAKMTKKESKAELQPREDIFFPRASDGYQRLELVNSPPVEMFNFARVVVDEYQYIKDIVAIVIGMLNAKSHWILSGTPALGGFLDVNNAVKLLGVSLGVNDFGAMTPDEFKKATSGMTKPELFSAYQETPSSAYIERRHRACQKFLDDFARTGEPVSDDIDCSSLLQLIELPAVEYAINFELMQRLVATKFEKPKGKGTGNDKEERIYAACNPWSTGQEALILRASHFSHNETSAQTAGSELVKKRNGQYEAQLEILLESLKTAQQIRKNMAGDYQKFTEWKAQVISNYYGDLDTTSDMIKLITKVEQVQSPAQPNPEGEEPNPRHVAAKLNKLAEELVNLKRSHRFLKIFCNVQCSVTKLSKRNNTSHGFTCAACNTGNLGPGAVTLLSKCGHLVCDQQCLPLDNGACPVAHCSSTNMAHHKIPGHVLGKGSCPEDRSKHGKKLEKILELIERIPDDDKILLFIQSPTLVRILKSILVEGRILFSQLSGGANDPKVLEEFQNGVVRKKNGEASKVLILNIGNSSAAGSNLTVANHIIFVSPFYASGSDAQYTYDAARTQAIGRARRYLQKKKVYIYDFLAMNTVDVDIFELRSSKIVNSVERPDGELSHELVDPQPGEVSEYGSCISEYFLQACAAST